MPGMVRINELSYGRVMLVFTDIRHFCIVQLSLLYSSQCVGIDLAISLTCL